MGSTVTVDVGTAGAAADGVTDARGRVWLSVGGEVRDIPAIGGLAGRMAVPVPGGVPVVVHATGPAAAGLSATVTVPGEGGRAPVRRARCDRSRSEFWFVGPETIAGRDPLLVLTNPEVVPARAEVTVLTAGGTTAQAPDGVRIPPLASVTRRLSTWAPDADATAVRVQVRDGRLAALVLDQAGGSAPGDSVAVPVATSAEPASSVVVPGAAAGVGGADVVVAAPGTDAVIRIELLTASARFAPPGLAALRVPGGGVVRLPAVAAGAGVTAVRVAATSGGPVVAAVGLSIPDPGSFPAGSLPASRAGPASAPAPAPAPTAAPAPAPRRWWIPAAEAIPADPAAAVLLPAVGDAVLLPAVGDAVGDAAPSTLVLTAPAAAVTVWLDGDPVRVPAGRTVSVEQRAAVRMVTQGGPLVAARITVSAGELSLLTLTAAPRVVFAPVVVEDPGVALRRWPGTLGHL